MDRLIGVVMALQQGPATAAMLAKRFEVSRRTIMRDVDTLCELGVPLFADVGSRGGYRLAQGYQLPASNLDVKEAAAILLAIHTMQSYADTPFNAERWTAEDKIKATLTKPVHDELEAMFKALVVTKPAPRYTAPHLQALVQAAATSAWVFADYQSRSRPQTICIRPLRVYPDSGYWYCDAESTTHGEVRTFRADRFKTILSVSDTLVAEMDLSHRIPKTPAPESVYVKAVLTYAGMIQVETDPHLCGHVRPRQDDTWELEFICPGREVEWFIRYAYSLGLDLRVTEPEWVQQRIREAALEVAAQYDNSRASEL